MRRDKLGHGRWRGCYILELDVDSALLFVHVASVAITPDPLIPLDRGAEVRDRLLGLGYRVSGASTECRTRYARRRSPTYRPGSAPTSRQRYGATPAPNPLS